MYVPNDEYLRRFPSADIIPMDQLALQLRAAERDIDALTFNRIRASGIDALTAYQRDLVQQAVCEQANFRFMYADLLANPLSSYGINGVSMAWDTTKLKQYGGINTLAAIYTILSQAGLTYAGLDRG